MPQREGAVTFKGAPLTLIGPELHAGEQAPDYDAALVAVKGL